MEGFRNISLRLLRTFQTSYFETLQNNLVELKRIRNVSEIFFLSLLRTFQIGYLEIRFNEQLIPGFRFLKLGRFPGFTKTGFEILRKITKLVNK